MTDSPVIPPSAPPDPGTTPTPKVGAAVTGTASRFKMFGVPVGTTVAGAAVLAFRAWSRRRAERHKTAAAPPSPPAPLEPSETQALASAGDGDISLATPVVQRPKTTWAPATPVTPSAADPTESEVPVENADRHDAPGGPDALAASNAAAEVSDTQTPTPPAPSAPVRAADVTVEAQRAALRLGGGQKRIDAQHARGKLTARERIERLLDPGSFEEMAPYIQHRHVGFGLEKERHPGDGVVTGFGLIDGRRVAVFAQDFTVRGGSFSEVQAQKVGRLMDSATTAGLPIIAMLDSVGARIQEGVWSLAGFGDLFWHNTQASGVVPQISLMLGPCAGGAVYSPGLTDFVMMTRGSSYMFITGPDVIKTVTGEVVDVETLGGAHTHAATSGVAHFVADDENGAFQLTRRLLGYLPSNNADDPPDLEPDDRLAPNDAALDHLIPESAATAYDVRDAIRLIVDRDSFLEVHEEFAPNAVVGFGRLHGRVIALIGNQPTYLAGVLDINASDKIARFIRFADAFNIPIVTLVDCPGFLPGAGQEHQGIIRHGAKIVYAYSEATVPKVSVVLRKAYGGAYIVMSSKMIRTDVCFAWPTAEIAVMGPKGAVSILYAKQLAAAAPATRDAERSRLEGEFQAQFNSPFVAASSGHIDDVIYPRETRARVTAALEFLKDKQPASLPKKHGNIPL